MFIKRVMCIPTHTIMIISMMIMVTTIIVMIILTKSMMNIIMKTRKNVMLIPMRNLTTMKAHVKQVQMILFRELKTTKSTTTISMIIQ